MCKLKSFFWLLVSAGLFEIIFVYFVNPANKLHIKHSSYFNFDASKSYSKSCCTGSKRNKNQSYRCIRYENVYLPPQKNCQSRECGLAVQYIAKEQLVCKQYPIKASRYDMVMHWNICSTNVMIHCSKVVDVAILPRRVLYPGNIGHFTYDVLGNIVVLKHAIDKDGISASGDQSPDNVALIIPPNVHQLLMLNFKSFLQALGIKNTVQLGSLESSFMCFKAVYLPDHERSTPLTKDDIHFFQNYFNVSANNCKVENQFTILQRQGERSFENISSLIDLAKSSGFSNVVVVFFENMTLQEQMQTAYCSKIFMGVQGAGMTWSHFLPTNGVLIEIGYQLWKNYLYSNKVKLAGRHDIKNFNVKCSGIISQTLWQRYATKHNVSGVLDEEKKQLILALDAKNDELRYGETIWKHASCLCEEKHLGRVFKSVKRVLFQ